MSAYGLVMAAPPAHSTHPRLQIRTAHDAHRVFEAVRRGLLPLIRRRLSPSERDLLSSGQVFVWEEAPTGAAAGDETSQTTSGLERWTDGRRWSQSRMREPFLFYEEKVQTTAEEKQAKADRRARKASTTSDSQPVLATLQPVRRQDRPTKLDGLTKQTYSSYVYFPSSNSPTTPPQPLKWHCVAYFSAADWNVLPGIEAYPDLNAIVVPDGVYVSTKGTGKTGAPPPSATSLHSGNVFPPITSSPVSYYDNNTGVGPIRRPHSRSEHSLSPYPTNGPSPSSSSASTFSSPSSATPKGRANSFGEGRPSSSYSPRTSFGSLPHPPPARSSSYTHAAYSTTPGASTAAAVVGVYGHHHSSSTSSSSASTSSPPTPGFGAPIPPPNGFRQSSEEARRGQDVDTIMYDAPTLRTPTKENPSTRTRSASRTSEYFSTTLPSEQTNSSSNTTPGAPNALPSLPSLLGQGWQTSSSGRSREDSRALGAFRLAL